MKIKLFKQYILESNNEIQKINNILLKYINGNMPDDYENLQSNVKDLFKQIIDIFNENNINLQIMKDNKPFDGSGIIVDTNKPIHLDLELNNNTKISYKLHVEIKREMESQDYFFSALKVE